MSLNFNYVLSYIFLGPHLEGLFRLTTPEEKSGLSQFETFIIEGTMEGKELNCVNLEIIL